MSESEGTDLNATEREPPSSTPDRTGGPVSAWGAVGLLQLYCSDTMAPEPMRAAQVAAAPNVLFDQSKIVSRDLHRQTDSQTGQVFVQDRFLSRDEQGQGQLSIPGKPE